MKKGRILWLLALVSLLIPVNLPAADKTESEEAYKLEEVVVTASRFEQEARKVPANVSVITREDIEDSNAQNITDILKYETGVTIRDLLGNGKTAQVDVRGFGETGPYNTLVMVDGRRVNEIDLNGTDWTQIPLEQVGRIEILRGSGSVLYGSGTSGGVVNIITRTPSEKFEAKASATAGSYSMHKEEVSLAGRAKNFCGSIYGIKSSTDGYRDNNSFNKEDFGGKLLYDVSDMLSLRFSGSSHEDEYDLPGALTKAQYDLNRKANLNPLDKGGTDDSYTTFGADLDFEKYGSLLMDISYRDRFSMTEYPDTIFPYKAEIDSETCSLTPRYILDAEFFGYSNKVIAGVDLEWTDYQQNALGGFFIPITTLTSRSDNKSNTIGFYLHDELSVTDNIILTLGARREKVEYDLSTVDLTGVFTPLNNETTKREEAWEIGLTWLCNDRTSAFIRANQSYRFALLDELVFYDFVTSAITLKSLEPQVGKNYEIGVRHTFVPGVKTEVTLYHADIKNELFYNPLTFENVNHPATVHEGIEFEANVDIFKYIAFHGNYSYESAKLDKTPFENNRIPSIPKHRANLGMQIRNIFPGITTNADCNYVGSRYSISDWGNDNGKLDSYYTLDLKVSYKRKMLEAFVGVNNVTNKRYATYVVENWAGLNYYPAPERNWLAGLKFTY